MSNGIAVNSRGRIIKKPRRQTGSAREEMRYVPVELDGMKEALGGEFFEVVFDYDEEGNRYEIKIPISWRTIKAIHKAIIASTPNPRRPRLREVAPCGAAPDKLKDAAEKAFALLGQLGEEIRWTPASLQIIDNLRTALEE